MREIHLVKLLKSDLSYSFRASTLRVSSVIKLYGVDNYILNPGNVF